jgi:hypothetical protein
MTPPYCVSSIVRHYYTLLIVSKAQYIHSGRIVNRLELVLSFRDLMSQWKVLQTIRKSKTVTTNSCRQSLSRSILKSLHNFANADSQSIGRHQDMLTDFTIKMLLLFLLNHCKLCLLLQSINVLVWKPSKSCDSWVAVSEIAALWLREGKEMECRS